MHRERKESRIIEYSLCFYNCATTVLALPTGNLNGNYLRPSHAVTDGAVQGQVPGFRNPPADTRVKAIGGVSLLRSGLYQAEDTPIHRLSAVEDPFS
jgi:hypothetical protein